MFCIINEPDSTSPNVLQRVGTLGIVPYVNGGHHEASEILREKDKKKDENRFQIPAFKGVSVLPFRHPCANFTFPPPPPPTRRRLGPRRKLDFLLLVFIIRVVYWNIAFTVIE